MLSKELIALHSVLRDMEKILGYGNQKESANTNIAKNRYIIDAIASTKPTKI